MVGQSEFDPELLGESDTEERLEALYTGGATPTEEERSRRFAAYMDRTHSGETSALNVVVGWELVDDQKRKRLMVTYQEDAGSFGGVAGLYFNKADAAADFGSFGDFEWYW